MVSIDDELQDSQALEILDRPDDQESENAGDSFNNISELTQPEEESVLTSIDNNEDETGDIDTAFDDNEDVKANYVGIDDTEEDDDDDEQEHHDHRVKVLSEVHAGDNIDVVSKESAPVVPVKIREKRKKWYIIHTYSGHENKVKINLERRIESMNMADKIFRVEVPQKPVTKIKDGKRTEKEENIFPGYVLVEMLMDDDSWYVVRHTPGVTKFVGSQKKPIAAKDSEIKRILFRSQPTATKVEIDLKVGDRVSIISGPFSGFEGPITEVSPEKERLKAIVSIFERDTPVELTFSQVDKIR